jgi:hypothetical protein
VRELRLKLIVEADFRKSEETNFLELKKSGKLPKLRKGEGVLFISKSKNQLVFVEQIEQMEVDASYGGRVRLVKAHICSSQRFRIRGAKWNPLMLQNYAEHAGFKIPGIKRFESYMKGYARA